MENKARKKRKTETVLSDINKKNRHINDDIHKEISGIKYDIYLVKESIGEIIKKHISSSQHRSNKHKKKDKILNLERIIKENEIKRVEEMYELKSEIQEIKEMILNIHFQKVNINKQNIKEVIKDTNMSYIN